MTVIWAFSRRSTIQGTAGSSNIEFPEHTAYGSTSVHFGQPSTCTPTTSGNIFVSGNGHFSAEWALTPDATAMDFTLTAATTGWLAMGK